MTDVALIWSQLSHFLWVSLMYMGWLAHFIVYQHRCVGSYNKIFLNFPSIEKVMWKETSQELRMLSSVTINCQITKIVMNPGSQLSEL